MYLGLGKAEPPIFIATTASVESLLQETGGFTSECLVGYQTKYAGCFRFIKSAETADVQRKTCFFSRYKCNKDSHIEQPFNNRIYFYHAEMIPVIAQQQFYASSLPYRNDCLHLEFHAMHPGKWKFIFAISYEIKILTSGCK
jgi:hypothetical protein